MADAIFIVGYYRSGTSALSGALSRAGVKFYNDADPNEHNPLGFYEIPELIQYDVDLFARLGVEWTDVRGLPPGWAERADLGAFWSRLEEIIRRRFTPADRLWGLKHPHLCRTLPAYERAARQAGHKPHVVHIFRDPWTAAASQQRKNGLSRAHALLLWLSYASSAERLARHLPRCWTTYQELLADPAAQLRQIAEGLGLALPARGIKEAASYLTGQLNRSEPLPREGLSRPLGDLAARVWAAIQARDFRPALWDEFAAATADLVGLLNEIGASRGRAIPALGGSFAPVATAAGQEAAPLRPPERSDEAAQRRLLRLKAQVGALPRLAVVIAAPAGRAHAVNDTLAALEAQWEPPARILILAAETLELEGRDVTQVEAAPEAMTRALCAAVNAAAASADYVAILNAGDCVTPDACLRFALQAAASAADMLYCDEIVPRAAGQWLRHKPGWDVTRLRQSAYLGDWVWYNARFLRHLSGFDAAYAGAEEYEFQLRLAEAGGRVERVAEALFTRSAQSRRDDIRAELFCARAAQAVQAHLHRAGLPAEVQNRQHLGLFHHLRSVVDPGTSIIMLCDGGDIPTLDRWLTTLLTGAPLTGPVILAGAVLSAELRNYLTAVTQQGEALEGKVLAVAPSSGLTQAEAFRQALALVTTPHVAVLDVRAEALTPHWLEALRARLADPGVAVAAARTLMPLARGDKLFAMVQGPIVVGADARLGAGHMADDPGPGGWLLVDQEASAVAPPGLLARSAALAACAFPPLVGDALWLELGAQLRATGARLVWTPDVSFVMPPGTVEADGAAARPALGWADPYHHPALSLHGDLLAAEARTGLVPATPADPQDLLLTSEPGVGGAVLNAAHALRRDGVCAADWVPERPSAAELGRRAPTAWVRVNPAAPAFPHSPAYSAVYTSHPEDPQGAISVLTEAEAIYATSPALAAKLSALAPAGRAVALWRPALSRRIWADLQPGTGLNTKPRLLWVDEGNTPPWWLDLAAATQDIAAWIVVERAGAEYPGAMARLRPPGTETAWSQALAELGPQLLLRPAAQEPLADHYPVLLAAAAGCHILADARFDLPASLGALRLQSRQDVWHQALRAAVADLSATLAHGRKARQAALALPALEDAPPPWLAFAPVFRSAAE